jgi:hypothetical protein
MILPAVVSCVGVGWSDGWRFILCGENLPTASAFGGAWGFILRLDLLSEIGEYSATSKRLHQI